ncbi:hypothetical protein HKBW3S42_01964 [Candidatus Hakubella thermalkaliphila]|uniref:Uncharacterized protein n=1 Tax=Candidatus Hakubella thermalkaliphila TaxID=2754717 RepID=A0A6V8PMZ3_9ACTN|nr:hypothetical protein HKBW3S42_01964 [Candidatus Hakubella thermalkaliphila]
MFSAGRLTGAEFPIAVNRADRFCRSVSKTAGNFYALDLFGAFIGAIITAVLFIPAMGIERTIILSMAIKASSVIITFVGSSRK